MNEKISEFVVERWWWGKVLVVFVGWASCVGGMGERAVTKFYGGATDDPATSVECDDTLPAGLATASLSFHAHPHAI